MSQGAYVTLVGFVAGDPILRKTKDGTTVTDVRVGATTRVLDRSTGEWRDSDTSYFTVNCWRRLGEHAKASLHKGDPVVVKGRFHTRSYEDKTGRLRTEVEIAAETVGHDLSRGISNYMRTRTPADAAGDQAAGAVQAVGSSEHVPASDLIDDEALKQFERELDAGLSEDELAAQARDQDDQDDEDYGDDEHEAIGTPGTPRTPEASMPI
jgi:single-strand DNA-binding protein